MLLSSLIIALKPVVFQAGDHVIRQGEIGREMYVISRGEVEVIVTAGMIAPLKAALCCCSGGTLLSVTVAKY